MGNLQQRGTVLFLLLTVFFMSCRKGSSTEAGGLRFIAEPSGNLVVKLGSSAQLPCAAIETDTGDLLSTSAITWFYNNSLLHIDANSVGGRFSVASNGSLNFSGVLWSDQGSYRCSVSRPNGTLLSSVAEVYITRLSGWVREPDDLEAHIGGTARFYCSVRDAIPNPASYSWSHNDLPLQQDDERIIILSSGFSILQITNVRSSDAGVYKCSAKNSAGQETSRPANLSVVAHSPESSPTSTSNPVNNKLTSKGLTYKAIATPHNQSVPLGGTAVLECLLELVTNRNPNFGSAESMSDVISWRRGISDDAGSSVVNQRADRKGPNLMIRNVLPSDAGRYACFVHGVLVAIATLNVNFPPSLDTMRERPSNIIKSRGESARFKCTVKSNPMPEISWYKNGKKLSEGGTVKIFPASKEPPNLLGGRLKNDIYYTRDLLVSNVQQGDEGIYQCIASNTFSGGGGAVTAAAQLIFDDSAAQLVIEDYSGDLASDLAPVRLSADVVPNQRSVYLSWDNPKLKGGKIPNVELTTYIVHFYESGGTENAEAFECDLNSPRCIFACCQAVPLKPFTNYTFFVSGIFRVQGRSIFSAPSNILVQRTSDAVARGGAPLILTALSEPGSVQLNWADVPKELLPGTLREFRIEYREENADRLDAIIMSVPSVLREQRIKGLVIGNTYLFRVIPVTGAGVPENMDDKRFSWTSFLVTDVVTNKKIPAPVMEKLVVLSSTSIEVVWSMSYVANITQFRISWSTAGAGRRSAFVPGDQTSLKIESLLSGKQYDVAVAAVDSNDSQGYEAIQSVRVPELTSEPTVIKPQRLTSAVLVEPPMSINCNTLSSRSLRLEWKRPPTTRNIVKYVIRISQMATDPDEIVNASSVQYQETDKTTFDIRDLEVAQGYMVSVKSVDQFGYDGPFSQEVSCSTQEEPPSEPLGLTVQRMPAKLGYLLAQWFPPLSRNGANLHYILWYTETNSERGWLSHSVPGNVTHVELTGLDLQRDYVFVVMAENAAGKGKASEKFDFNAQPKPTPFREELPAKIIIQPSYTEGIVLGVCIAVISLALFSLILMCKKKLFPQAWFSSARSSLPIGLRSPSKSNCHLAGDHLVSGPDVHELKTLLPCLVELSAHRHDAKGGEVYSKSAPVHERTSQNPVVPNLNDPMPPIFKHFDQHLSVLILDQDRSQQKPLLTPASELGGSENSPLSTDVYQPNVFERHCDLSSRSPSDSSVCSGEVSWDSSDDVTVSQPPGLTILGPHRIPSRKRPHSANDSPPSGPCCNLADSGIGFDPENSGSIPCDSMGRRSSIEQLKIPCVSCEIERSRGTCDFHASVMTDPNAVPPIVHNRHTSSTLLNMLRKAWFTDTGHFNDDFARTMNIVGEDRPC